MKTKNYFFCTFCLLLISSCGSLSITQMRYSKGFNIGFCRVEEAPKHSVKKTETGSKPIHSNHPESQSDWSPDQKGFPDNTQAQLISQESDHVLTPAMEATGNVSKLKDTENKQVDVSGSKWTSSYQHNSLQMKVSNRLKGIYSGISSSKLMQRPQLEPQAVVQRSGVFGILGFVLSVLSILFYPLAILGLIFSIIGMGRGREFFGLAVAGLVLSIVVLVVVLYLIAVFSLV